MSNIHALNLIVYTGEHCNPGNTKIDLMVGPDGSYQLPYVSYPEVFKGAVEVYVRKAFLDPPERGWPCLAVLLTQYLIGTLDQRYLRDVDYDWLMDYLGIILAGLGLSADVTEAWGEKLLIKVIEPGRGDRLDRVVESACAKNKRFRRVYANERSHVRKAAIERGIANHSQAMRQVEDAQALALIAVYEHICAMGEN